MKWNPLKIGLATASAFAVFWVLASLVITGTLLSSSRHMEGLDFVVMVWQMNSTGYIFGLLAWSIIPGIIAAQIVFIYNKLIYNKTI